MRAPPFDHALITWGRSLRLVRVWLNRYQSSRYGATCRTWSFAPAVSRSNDPMYEECGDIKLTMVVGGWGTSPSGEHSWNVLCRLRAILALCVDWQRGGVTSRSILSIACELKPSPRADGCIHEARLGVQRLPSHLGGVAYQVQHQSPCLRTLVVFEC